MSIFSIRVALLFKSLNMNDNGEQARLRRLFTAYYFLPITISLLV